MVEKYYRKEWITCKSYQEMGGMSILRCIEETCPCGNYQTNEDALKGCKTKGRFDQIGRASCRERV